MSPKNKLVEQIINQREQIEQHLKIWLKTLTTKRLYTGLILFGFFVLMQMTTWLPLRFWNIWGGGNFIDSQQVLDWSYCYGFQENLIFQNSGECSGYIYGSTLIRILSFFNITTSSTQVFGYMFMFLLALTLSFQIGNLQNLRNNPNVLVVVVSPPLLLLAERANFDILMLALISVAGGFFAKNYHAWALLPLTIATLLKFYTLPLFFIFFLLNRDKKRKLLTLIIGVMVSTRVFLDLKLIQGSFPSGTWGKFGVSIWARYVDEVTDSDLSEALANFSGLFIFLSLYVITVYILKKRHLLLSNEANNGSNERIFFYLFFSTHASCYFLGMNYDYRLVFFAVASIIYLHSFASKENVFYKLILVLTILSIWLTYPSSALAPIGDLAVEIMTAVLGIQFVQFLKLDLKKRNAMLRLGRSN